MPRAVLEPSYFATAAHFAAWLAAHAASAPELRVGFHKVASGQPSMRWAESVDEALCVGWIDGVRQRVDEHRYTIRFTPRRPGSHWSAVNIARVAELVAQGRLQPAGLAAFAARTEANTARAAYEQPERATLCEADRAAFCAQAQAWAFFQGLPPSYHQRVLWWVSQAKAAATRERRLWQLIAACAEGRRL